MVRGETERREDGKIVRRSELLAEPRLNGGRVRNNELSSTARRERSVGAEETQKEGGEGEEIDFDCRRKQGGEIE